MRRFTAFVYRLRLPIIVVFSLLTVFFGYWIKDLRVDSDVVSYLPKEDPAVRLFNHLDAEFGGNNLAMVVVEADDIFSSACLRDIAVLTEAFRGLPGVSSVTSLTNVMDIRKGADGGIEIGKLVDTDSLPTTAAESRALRERVMGRERYKGSLISNDGNATLVICQIAAGADTIAVIHAMQAATASAAVPEKLSFGGLPLVASEMSAVILHDIKVLIPIVALLIILTLYLSFGTLRGVVVPLLAVAISTIWTMGLMSLLRVHLTLVSDIIPALLVAIGTAPCIHILSKFDEDTGLYGQQGEPAQAAFREVGVRVFLAAITIVLGFSSFIIGSYLTAIRDFGIFASIGVCFSLLVSLMFVPALLASIRLGGQRKTHAENRPLQKAMTAWGEIVVRRRRAILVGCAVALVAGIAGMPFIQRKADFGEFFAARNPVRLTETLLHDRFGGSRPLQVDFVGDMQNPFVLKEMLRFERFLAGENLARHPISAADVIAEMNDIMEGEKTIPDDQGRVANLMFLIEGQDTVNQLLNGDKTEGQIQAMTGMTEVDELARTVASMETYISGMEKTLAVVDVSALAPPDAATVMRYRSGRAAQALRWMARARLPGTALDERALAVRLAALYAGGGTLPAPAQGLAEILPLMPAALQADPSFRQDAEGELADLAQARAAVPPGIVERLSGASGVEPETISFNVAYTGMPLITWHMDQSILKSQGESLLIALAFIFILLAIKLHSVRGGILGLAPIVLAIAVMFGFMGLAGIPINVATVLVASIALGIGIDYVIHFSVRFTTYYRGPGSAAEAVIKTIQTTGTAIIINVLAVTMGFVTLVFANLVPLQQFGILTAIAMIASGVGAFTLLPALILMAPTAFVGAQKRQSKEAITP